MLEADVLKQKEGLVDDAASEETLARMELDYTISIAQGWHPTKWKKTEASITLKQRHHSDDGGDKNNKVDIDNESEIIEIGRLSAIDVCQKSLDNALAQQPESIVDDRTDLPRPLVEGTATLTLPQTGRVVHCRLSLRVHCECVSGNNEK